MAWTYHCAQNKKQAEATHVRGGYIPSAYYIVGTVGALFGNSHAELHFAKFRKV